ncbi:MAG: TetR/AcrR family transcriptional regulator [Pseudonocardiaceae bacterium]|nr:TetR/AcrR family transcriptional regulator [Pseudonocardiaceae bacterium]
MPDQPAARGRPRHVRDGLETRSRITAAAAGLMRRHGYSGTGLNDVVAASHAPKGSLYHYFPGGKEQLASEAVALGARSVTELIDRAFATSPDAGAALHLFAEVFAGNLTRSGYRDGCPVATVTLDAATESELIRTSCAASFAGWRDAIAGWLERGGHGPDTAGELAVVVLSAFEGAMVLARALHDVAPLYAVANSLGRWLDEQRRDRQGDRR